MQIKSITQITWKTWTPCHGEFPCWACRFGEATKFIEFSNENWSTKLPVCDKCAEFAATNPTWFDEILLTRRLKSAAYEGNHITDDELKSMAEDGILRGAE